MNVYDFDKTIYAGDSTVDFYFYCLQKYPVIIFRLPKQVAGFLQYKGGTISKERFKERFFCFLQDIPNIADEVRNFWNQKKEKICPWYLRQKSEDDVIISASPSFLLEEICLRLGICQLLASNVDAKTGQYTGKNCYGEEKVSRFRQKFGKQEIDQFYSDSTSDLPMAKIAKEAFLVKKGTLEAWRIERL